MPLLPYQYESNRSRGLFECTLPSQTTNPKTSLFKYDKKDRNNFGIQPEIATIFLCLRPPANENIRQICSKFEASV